MEKKKILITGAGSGLGKQAAITLASRGHKVYATVHFENQIEDIEKIKKEKNLDIECFKLDILLKEDREKIANYDIDVFISNAAIGDSGSISEVSVDRIENVMETNVFSSIKLIQIVLRRMIEINKKGRIIVISSLVGRIPMAFLGPYCMSKFAIEGYATCLRKEMKQLPNAKIDVCMIEPGAYATGFNKDNNEKKYTWMEEVSYFKDILPKLKVKQEKMWNLLEVKPYNSIISQYVKATETKHLRARYTAPKLQSFFIQLGRILGM